MAYDFVKLSKTTLVESASDPNLLIEDGGEIKRISANDITTPQVQCDWNETDINNPAFILNKPENVGKNNVITYMLGSGCLMLNGESVTTQSVVDAWNNGDVLRISNGTIAPYSEGLVLGIRYSLSAGKVLDKSGNIDYLLNSAIGTTTF